jgi:DNA-directed RNA polymerase specialized sigma24 family protein
VDHNDHELYALARCYFHRTDVHVEEWHALLEAWPREANRPQGVTASTQEAFIAYTYGGFTAEAIAERFGITRDSALRKIRRGKLRRVYEPHIEADVFEGLGEPTEPLNPYRLWPGDQKATSDDRS